jgi:hypothetical protein
MRLGDLDRLRDAVCERFGLPIVVSAMDNPEESDVITIVNMICAARTIIPGKDDVDPIQVFLIESNPTPYDLVALLRKQARRRPRHIGRKPQVLYDKAADCIEKLLGGQHDD